jgi:hypothetical protein
MLTWEKIGSRESIGKFLLKLPSGIFPSYRCVINVVPDNDKGSNLSSDTQSDDYRLSRPKIWKKRRRNSCKLRCNEDVTVKDKSVVNIPPPPPFPYHLLNLSDVEHIERPTITIECLANAMLKKPTTVSFDRETPVRDMLQILRKRYSAMHSPTPKKPTLSFLDDYDDGIDLDD